MKKHETCKAFCRNKSKINPKRELFNQLNVLEDFITTKYKNYTKEKENKLIIARPGSFANQMKYLRKISCPFFFVAPHRKAERNNNRNEKKRKRPVNSKLGHAVINHSPFLMTH